MSAEERKEVEDKLTRGLKESFEKMLLRKKQLGESVVTCDENGNVITLTADEAWQLYKGERSVKCNKIN